MGQTSVRVHVQGQTAPVDPGATPVPDAAPATPGPGEDPAAPAEDDGIFLGMTTLCGVGVCGGLLLLGGGIAGAVWFVRSRRRPGPHPPDPAAPRLTVVRGTEPGRAYPLNRPVMTLGRDAGNSIVLAYGGISRRHARIAQQGASIVIEDLGSANGTFVNGDRLSAARPLARGDVIDLAGAIALRLD